MALTGSRGGTIDVAIFDPVLLFQRVAGSLADPWQVAVLRSRAGQVILNCSRQVGKSTVTSVLALHRALHTPNSLVLLLSPSLRQSSELFRKVTYAYRVLGRPVGAEHETALQLHLVNGSRVISLPGTEETVRGYSGVSLLIIDEAARVSDELYFSLRPMLAVSGGRLMALSTPYGRRGWFYEAWNSSEPWERVSITADQCPRISPEFLEQERKALGPRWYAQEYCASFEDTVGSLFSGEALESLLTSSVKAVPFPE